MYKNIKLCAMLEQQRSYTFLCNMGVRWDENLAPLVFAFFVNDMKNKFIECVCTYLKFKDDLLYSCWRLLILMHADDTFTLPDSKNGMKQVPLALD